MQNDSYSQYPERNKWQRMPKFVRYPIYVTCIVTIVAFWLIGAVWLMTGRPGVDWDIVSGIEMIVILIGFVIGLLVSGGER